MLGGSFAELVRGKELEGELTYWLPIGVVAASACALTLHSAWNRKGKGRYLCDDCRFNSKTACLKSERPKAVVCTSYRAAAESEAKT